MGAGRAGAGRALAGLDGEEAALIQANDEDADEHAAKGGGASVTQTYLNSTKAMMGAAAFELPHAFMQAGSLGAVLGMVCLAALSGFSLMHLAYAGRMVPDNPRPTYPELGQAAFGVGGKMASWFGFLLMTLGVCGAYVVLISRNMAEMTPPSQFWWTIIIICVLIPFSWLRSFKFLAPTSLFGIVALLFALIIVTSDGYTHAGSHNNTTAAEHYAHQMKEIPLFRGDTYFLFLGNAAFLYLSATPMLPLEQGMADRRKFFHPFFWTVVSVSVIAIGFSFFAWVSYGDCYIDGNNSTNTADCVQSEIVANMPKDAVTTKLVKASLSASLVFTLIVYLFPFSEALEAEVFDVTKFGSTAVELQRNALRVVIILVSQRPCVSSSWSVRGLARHHPGKETPV